jgi:hypothetical protein
MGINNLHLSRACLNVSFIKDDIYEGSDIAEESKHFYFESFASSTGWLEIAELTNLGNFS